MGAIGRRRTSTTITAVAIACAWTAVTAVPTSAAIKLGVNVADAYLAVPSEYEFGRMRVGGVEMARYQFGWARIQPRKDGPYDWRHHDEAMANAAAAGIRLLPLIVGTPDWVEHSGRGWPVGPDGLYRYYLYLAAIQERYGKGGDFWRMHPELPARPLRAYEIWNEPNRGDMQPQQTGIPAPKLYARLLDISSKAIEAGGGGAKIVTGGMTERRSKQETTASRFFRLLFRIQGVRRDVDAVGIHPYAENPRLVAGVIRRLRATVDRYYEGAPLWITEVGWGTAGQVGHILVKGENTQANYLRRTFGAILKSSQETNIDAALWYSFRDLRPPSRPLTWDAHAGLFETSGRKKPAWNAFAHLADGRAAGDL